MKINALCEQAGIARNTYYKRRRAGLSHEQALSVPSKHGTPLADRLPLSLSRSQAAVNAALRAWR